MESIEELNRLSDRIDDFKEEVKGERATINTFILPFIRLLGYDTTNPKEVKYEFTADFGVKQGEKVDIAILKDDRVIMLIECKDWHVNISESDVSQLYRYFTAVTEARIGVLTNGIVYRLYTDSEKPNVMDAKPFFEFNMSKIRQSLINVLNNFTKENFDLEKTRSTAIDLKHRGEIKQILNKQLETPTNGFVEFFHSAIKSQMEVPDFTDVVKRAFNEFINEMNKKEPNRSDEQNEKEYDKEPNESDEQNEKEHDKEPNRNDEQNDKESNESSERPSKLKFTNLRVTMPDGSVIHHQSGKETYIEVLEKLGLEKVMKVRPNIVSKEQFSQKSKGVKRGEFWVRGTIKLGGTKNRKAELDKIAELLGVKLKVEIVEKN